jgi:phage tail-like protein
VPNGAPLSALQLQYPAVGFHFQVRIFGDDSQAHAAFAEVSGLDVTREVQPLREGGENRFVHQLPGGLKHENLVLKRGIVVRSDPLFEWCRGALESDLGVPLTTRLIEVSLLDAAGSRLINWQCAAAWPVKWTIGGFDAMKNEVAMETIEFAYSTLSRTH